MKVSDCTVPHEPLRLQMDFFTLKTLFKDGVCF